MIHSKRLTLQSLKCPLFSLLLMSLAMMSVQSASVQAAGKKYALIIGVKKYRPSQPLPELTYTENDANELATVLTAGGYDVTLMTQTVGRSEGKEVFSPHANYIRDQLEAMVKSPFLTAEDVVLVALTGHGVQYEFVEGIKRTGRFYFCPADADVVKLKTANEITKANQLLDLSELYLTLNACKAGGKLLLVDACRNDPTKPTIARAASSLTLPPLPPPPGGIAAFFSCSAHEQAIEDQDLKHGVFFHHIIEGLKGDADVGNAKRPVDGEITLSELSEHVGRGTYDFVRKKYQGYKQTPELRGEFRLSIPLLSLASAPTTPTKPLLPKSSKTSLPPDANSRTAGELKEFNQALGLKMVWCPPGNFKMGSLRTERFSEDRERPRLEVTLTRGFWIGQTEVTQSQWKTVMATEPWKGKPNIKEGDDMPATYISHGDAGDGQFEADSATLFCQKLTEQELKAGRLAVGWSYTLPTEAQWEYACRAGTKTAYSFGNNEKDLSKYGWNGDEVEGDENYAHPVRLKLANPWGIHDMHGNVWEYCADWYHDKSTGGQDPIAPLGDELRAMRGGGLTSFDWFCRSATRFWCETGERDHVTGFRLVQVPANP